MNYQEKSISKAVSNIFMAAFYALKGFKALITSEVSFIYDCIFVIIVTPIILVIAKPELIWGMYLITSGILILLVEGLNSAIESTCNALSTNYNELIGRAKDIAAFCVLLSLIHYLLIATIIFYIRYFK